ncbi:hypothetical protein [Listeria welshimeri]|nr:hypothetical protein [Listeria welshimeri]
MQNNIDTSTSMKKFFFTIMSDLLKWKLNLFASLSYQD